MSKGDLGRVREREDQKPTMKEQQSPSPPRAHVHVLA